MRKEPSSRVFHWFGERMGERWLLLRYPHLQFAWGGPLNNQRFRQRIFFDLHYAFPFNALVETGTYRGATTALFASTCLPVFTTELSPRFHAFSQWRFFLSRGHVHLFRKDSRTFLRDLAEDPAMPRDPVFFYLDAHWGDDLPLREELEIIYAHWPDAVVMIDDFEVPGTTYRYDDYGPGRTLNLAYIEPVMRDRQLVPFFPAIAAEQETGIRRGCVVLANHASAAVIDRSVPTLRRHARDPN